MYVKINSILNGNLDNYPKFIFIDYFKHKHWRELTMAYDLDYEAFDDVLTSVFDDVIDFEKTEFIKTSDELTNVDRLKLFLFQIVNSKTDTLKLRYECKNPECKGEFEVDINLMNLKEIKLMKKIDKVYLDKDKKLFFKIPSRSDISSNNKKVIYYKEEFLKRLRELRENIEDEEEFKKKEKELLDKFYFIKGNNEIKTIYDIDFDNYTAELVALMNFVGGIEFNTIDFYLDFIFNNEASIYKVLAKCIEEYRFGYDTKIKFKCKHCGKNYEEDLPIVPKFFFM